MVKTNNKLNLGVFLIGLTLFLKQIIGLPEFISGLGMGLGLTLEFLGVFSINHDLSKLKNMKLALIKALR